MKPTILTHDGEYFDYLAPHLSNVDINTIAHALSNICRFTGHTEHFYSVAQHSVIVSYLVPEEYAMEGLMHDAHEAYVGDVAAPLKQLMPDYQRIEERVQATVRHRFGLPLDLDPSVKIADLCALATEERDLMPKHDDAWPWESIPGVKPSAIRITPLPPGKAELLFLTRFHVLAGAKP